MEIFRRPRVDQKRRSACGNQIDVVERSKVGNIGDFHRHGTFVPVVIGETEQGTKEGGCFRSRAEIVFGVDLYGTLKLCQQGIAPGVGPKGIAMGQDVSCPIARLDRRVRVAEKPSTYLHAEFRICFPAVGRVARYRFESDVAARNLGGLPDVQVFAQQWNHDEQRHQHQSQHNELDGGLALLLEGGPCPVQRYSATPKRRSKMI